MKTSFVLIVFCLFIDVYSTRLPSGEGSSTSNAEVEQVNQNGQYSYHVAIIKKGTTRILCDGVIISNHWVMTMKECFKGVISPDDRFGINQLPVALVVGGVASLSFRDENNRHTVQKLTYSVSSFWIPGESHNPNPIVVLEVEKGNDLLAQRVESVRPRAAVLEKVQSTEEDFNGLRERLKGKTLHAPAYQKFSRKFHHTTVTIDEMNIKMTSSGGTLTTARRYGVVMSKLGAPLVV